MFHLLINIEKNSLIVMIIVGSSVAVTVQCTLKEKSANFWRGRHYCQVWWWWQWWWCWSCWWWWNRKGRQPPYRTHFICHSQSDTQSYDGNNPPQCNIERYICTTVPQQCNFALNQYPTSAASTLHWNTKFGNVYCNMQVTGKIKITSNTIERFISCLQRPTTPT